MDIVLIALLTFVGSAVGTLTGFGTSTIMVPVLVVFYPLPQALLLVGIVHWFGDIWKMLLFRSGVRWRLVLLFGVPGVVATALGGLLVFETPQELLGRILGAFLLGYVAFILLKGRFKVPQTNATTLTAARSTASLPACSASAAQYAARSLQPMICPRRSTSSPPAPSASRSIRAG